MSKNVLNSIESCLTTSELNKSFYERNFVTVDLLETELKSKNFENRIDIFWKTYKDFNFKKVITNFTDTLVNYPFERYELWVHDTPNTQYELVTTNSKLIVVFDVENHFDKI